MHTSAAALSLSYQEGSSFFSLSLLAVSSWCLFFHSLDKQIQLKKKWHFLARSWKVAKVYLALVSRWRMDWLANFKRRCGQQITDISITAELDSGHFPLLSVCTLVMFSLLFVGKKVCNYIVCPCVNLSHSPPNKFWSRWPTLSKFARETEVWKIWSSSKLYEVL